MKTKILIPLFVLLAGCNTGNKPLTEQQREAVNGEATAVIKEFFQTLAVNDTAKMSALVFNNPDFSFVSSGGVMNNKDMEQMMKSFFSVVEKQTFDTKSEKYFIVDPNCFVYTWHGKNDMFKKGGEPIMQDDNLLGSYIFRKTDGVWKLAYAHESSKIPEVADPVKVFTQIETDWNNAIKNKDEQALDKLYAKEYMYTDPDGKTSDRQQDIKDIISGNYKTLSPSVPGEIKVKMYGNVAVVNGMMTIHAVSNGKNVSGTNRFTDVFVMRDGRWQCVSTQSTKLAK